LIAGIGSRRLKNRWIVGFLRPSVVVLAAYILYVEFVLSLHQYDPTVFIQIGTIFADRASSVARLVHDIGFGPPFWKAGFDGQFYYYIALDPVNAWELLDTTARYQRILYPIIVRLLSFGYLPSIPFLMIIVNLASIFAGTEFLARLLKWFHLNSWYSLGYGFHIGQLVCLRKDLPEPLMYAFVIAAIYYAEARGSSRLAGIMFLLALFTKEPAILFIVAYAFGLLLSSRRRSPHSAALLVAVSVLPYAAYQLMLLYRFGQVAFLGVGNLQTLSMIPFYGVFQVPRPPFELVSIAVAIVIPATLSLAVFFRSVVRGNVEPLLVALLLNALFLVFLPRLSYVDVFTYGRVSLGLATAWIAHAGFSRNRRMLAYSILWAIPFQFNHLPE
jgi:hypothetical protein